MQLSRRHPVRTRRRGTPLLVPFGLALAAVAAAAPIALAQTISGTVAEAATGRPLDGALVMLMDQEGVIENQTVSRSDGGFSLAAPHTGPWTLAVELLGFRTIRSEPVEVMRGEWIILEVTMAAEAIPLDPVVVTARRSVGSPDIQRFYDRRDRARRTGIGHFVVRSEIDERLPNRPSDMLRTMSGVRVVRGTAGRGDGIRMSGGCIPAIYIDGVRINRVSRHDALDDFVTVMDIEGIEVYRGPSSQVGNLHDPSGCGLILVWTRAGVHDPDSTLRWKTVLGTLAVLLLIILVTN